MPTENSAAKPITPSETPDGKDLPQSAVVGDEGGAGFSAGGQASAKSGAGLGETTPHRPRSFFEKLGKLTSRIAGR